MYVFDYCSITDRLTIIIIITGKSIPSTPALITAVLLIGGML